MKKKNIPSVTINRLSIYHRCLEKILETEKGKDLIIISSFKIAEMTGINSAQIRKDLAYFGEFGKRGIGYPVIDLGKELKKILGLDKKWPVIIAGAGNLGKALVKYKGFQKRGFIIKGIFDNNPSKIGKRLGHIFISNIKEIKKFIQTENISIGIIVVQADSAQEVANKMVAGGVVPENFTSIIKKNKPDLVVLVDAVEMDLKSGEFRIISPDRISALHLTTHSMPLSFLISYLKEYTKELIFIGIQPEIIDYSNSVSPEVLKSSEEIIRILKGKNFKLLKKL